MLPYVNAKSSIMKPINNNFLTILNALLKILKGVFIFIIVVFISLNIFLFYDIFIPINYVIIDKKSILNQDIYFLEDGGGTFAPDTYVLLVMPKDKKIPEIYKYEWINTIFSDKNIKLYEWFRITGNFDFIANVSVVNSHFIFDFGKKFTYSRIDIFESLNNKCKLIMNENKVSCKI